MSLFPIPKGIMAKIITIQRNFFWNGSLEKKSLNLAAWDLLQPPKVLGGLGMGNLHHQNLALLFKWVWRFISEPSALWRNVIKEKYGYDNFFNPSELEVPANGGLWRNICAALMQNTVSKSLINSNIRMRIGNGERTRFWLDVWVGDSTLKLLCPRLFRISNMPNGVVAAFGFWEGLHWEWQFSWIRSFRPQDQVEWQVLISQLQRVVFEPKEADSFIWTPDKSGVYSVKSFYFEMAKNTMFNSQSPLKGFWRGLVPYRIEIFVWFATLGKLNTRSKLVRLGIIPAENIHCVLCGAEAEESNHLFIHCAFSSEIWRWWLGLWEVSWAFPNNVRDLFVQWRAPFGDKFFKKIWVAIFFIILWSIWKERNDRIFNGVSKHTNQIAELILLRVGWWIKGWGDPFPYNPDEILRNPQCLRWASFKDNLPPQVADPSASIWIPPPPSALKWNVDASMHPTLGKASIGGVLRNSEGKFKCLFSSPIPNMEINLAEIFAIHRALKISLSKPEFKNYHLIIESDSANAVQWCNKKSGGPWNIHFILNFIRNISTLGLHVSICHRGRASNGIADGLAKQGLGRNDAFIAWL